MLTQQPARWFLWWPVGMALGILLYFHLPQEPSLALSLGILGFMVMGVAFGHYFFSHTKLFSSAGFRFCLYSLLSIILGFSLANIRTVYLRTPLLTKALKNIQLTGTLIDIEHPDLKKPDKRRFILSNIDYHNLAETKGKLPTKIRINAAKTQVQAVPGDRIRCQVTLLPLSPPTTLQGYDFQRQAYFAGIGAVGRLESACQLVSNSPKTQLYQGRYHLTQALRHRLPGATGEIAAALITGDRTGIPKEIRQHFTDAGIAHILAISGLHVSLVAAIIFFLIRRSLACIPVLAENFFIKKWAAVVAIIATGFYLAISGFGFPAQRAFIMTLLVMLGILLDRNPLSMRTLAIAAIVILSLYPESILSISFQLSFAAVVALVAVYEGGYKPLKNWIYQDEKKQWYRRPIGYGAGIILTTLVATLATTPFIIHTFNRFTLQAMMGNLIAIPLTSFWIMPTAVLAVFSLNFGGIEWLFSLWGLGIRLLMGSAQFIAGLPGAAILVPTPHPAFLGLTSIGGLWLCLWQHRYRWWGLAPILASLAFLFYDCHPDIYLAGDGSVMAYSYQGSLYVSSEGRGKFYAEQWARERGGLPMKPWPSDTLMLKMGIILIAAPYPPSYTFISEVCDQHPTAWVFSNASILQRCHAVQPQKVVDRHHLKQKGSCFVYLRQTGSCIIYLKDFLGQRPWRLP